VLKFGRRRYYYVRHSVAPHVHHTWYVDAKGPLPFDTGYILVIVEAITRCTLLRYLPKLTADEVTEELDEAFASFCTRPVVIRHDNGPPFDSDDWMAFCKTNAILPVPGVPYHSQGQGMVETRIRGLAAAIIATFGAKAFMVFKLGPMAQKLSTFTSPLGKLRWLHGYYGWHSFPPAFQRLIMEHVVLPTLDDFPTAALAAWIDDLFAACRTGDELVAVSLKIVDRILAFGGRLNIDKIHLFVTRFDWCGVEVDLIRNDWRIAPSRVESLHRTPIPKDRTQLEHVMGILRHYFWGVRDQLQLRRHLAKLTALDVPGIRLSEHWTDEHTAAMKAGIDLVVSGDWIMVYDPTQPCYCTVDAAGNEGFGMSVYQIHRPTGKHRPIAYFSHGWIGSQIKWTPQVKEAYAAMILCTKVMRSAFPYATVLLLCDNKNLATETKSADDRVSRWKFDVKCAGAITWNWISGDFNSIADYASRSVVPAPTKPLSDERQFEMHIYALEFFEGGDTPVSADGAFSPPAHTHALAAGTAVPGHLTMATAVADTIAAQHAAPDSEKASWSGKHFSTVTLSGKSFTLRDGRLVVPSGASDLKNAFLRLSHDCNSHYTGADRTLYALRQQCRVWWSEMDADTTSYVNSCFRCAYGKVNRHGKSDMGTLNPTQSPR
jgi:hypothetical protein